MAISILDKNEKAKMVNLLNIILQLKILDNRIKLQ